MKEFSCVCSAGRKAAVGGRVVLLEDSRKIKSHDHQREKERRVVSPFLYGLRTMDYGLLLADDAPLFPP